MNEFNFATLAEQEFTSNSQNYLKPYEIYEVSLTKIEKTDLKGSKDPNATYQVVAIEFTGEDGIFSTNLFIPNRPEDFQRRENENTHKTSPSNWERFYMTLLQITEVLNPKASEKIKEYAKTGKIKSTDLFLDLIVKALNSKDLNKAYLKLVGRNNNGTVYSTLPTSCWVDSRDNRVKPLNFISTDKTKLNFSNYEIQQMNQYKNATPTSMPDVKDEPADEGLDLGGLEL